MALLRRPLPRRAIVGAFLGFAYGALIIPTGAITGEWATLAAGAAWALLALALLTAHAYAYYTYVTWALLWMVWRGVLAFRGEAGPAIGAALDVLVPLASVALLSSSGYVEATRAPPSG